MNRPDERPDRDDHVLPAALLQPRTRPAAGARAEPSIPAASPIDASPLDAPRLETPPSAAGAPASPTTASPPSAPAYTAAVRARPGPATRRERAITVETEGLGRVKVRRVTLGGIARCADRLRADEGHDDDALVDALIGEVTTLAADTAGARRRPDAGQLARLTDTDRRSIAAAVLTLEGVKAAGEGVVQHPLTSLALRYGPMVGLGDRAPRASMALDLPEAAPTGALPGDDARRLPGHAHAEAAAQSEPQIPLFDRSALPPAPGPFPGEADTGTPAATRAARIAAERSRAHLQALLDEQQRMLLELGDDHRALAAEVQALQARADRAAAATRRQRWIAAAAVALALAVTLAQAVVAARTERALQREQESLRAEVQKQSEALKELRAARAERAPLTRPPAKPAAPRPQARTGSGAR